MGETYQYTWEQVGNIYLAVSLANKFFDIADYAHIETKDYDLDIDTIGIRITIPHDQVLDEERKTL